MVVVQPWRLKDAWDSTKLATRQTFRVDHFAMQCTMWYGLGFGGQHNTGHLVFLMVAVHI
jgi:hypothetical protein